MLKNMNVRARCALPAILCAALTTVAAAGGGGGGGALMTIGSVGAEPGETVRVPVRLSTEDLVGAFDFVVDAAGLTVAGIDYSGVLFANGWDGWDTSPAVDAHVTAACTFPQDQVTGLDIPLLHLLVEVPADAVPSTQIPVRLSGVSVSDYSFIPYDVTLIEGSIVILSDDCAEDIDGNGTVGFNDLLAVISAWGPCDGACPADADASDNVGLSDLLMVLAGWGAC